MSKLEPTNKELMTEIKEVSKAMRKLDERIIPLERWKIAFDAANAAIAEYKQQNENIAFATKEKSAQVAMGINKDFVNVVLKFIALLASVVALGFLIIQTIKP